MPLVESRLFRKSESLLRRRRIPSMTVRCLPVLTLILLSGCSSTPSDYPAGSFDEARIREAIDRAVGAFGTSDIETLISLRTEDSVVLKPGAEPLLGKKARRASLEDVFDQFDVDETRTVEEIDVVGDRAIVWGTYAVTLTPKDGSASTNESGNYIDILHRQADGSWLFARTIWNAASVNGP